MSNSVLKPKKSVKSITYTKFRPQIRSRHPSHSFLRTELPLLPFRSIIRLGSTTEVEDGKQRIEINSVQSIKNSSSKLRMKECFTKSGVKTAQYWIYTGLTEDTREESFYDGSGITTIINNLPYPIVAKHHFGSKGTGNTLIKSQEELEAWMKGKTLSNYIFEKFYNYAHEFRLHITKDGCFYACRKALKADCPEDQKWRHHDDTCVWYLEENEKFFKPNSWNDIINDCIKALEAVGADLLAFDVKVQSPTNNKGKAREYQEYILLECNSAPSMDNGTNELSICATKYLDIIPKILKSKFIEIV